MTRKAPLMMLPLLLAACASVGNAPSGPLATATIASREGKPVGSAELFAAGEGASLKVELAGIAPGVHGVHLHAIGACVAPDFKSAGGHLNPDGKQHGMENPMGHHLGDLPNIVVGADGVGAASVELDDARAGILEKMFDEDGTAVVVHAGPDDYRTDPSGNSGGRVACGVFARD